MLSFINFVDATDPTDQVKKNIQALDKQDDMLCATKLLNERIGQRATESKDATLIAAEMQERILNGLVKADTVSICLTLIGADGSEYEPFLTFAPFLLSSKYTANEKRDKLKHKKIRVTLNKVHPNGRTVQRIGSIGNMTINEIIVGSTCAFERSINEYYPGARFEPSFNNQFTDGVARLL